MIFKGNERLETSKARLLLPKFQRQLIELMGKGRSAPEYELLGRKFMPQAHFTSLYPFENLKAGELKQAKPYWDDMVALLAAHKDHIIAFYLSEAMGWFSFSLEVQFDSDPVAAEVLNAFRKEEVEEDESGSQSAKG